MNNELQAKLVELRANYRALTGQGFKHFYCPILFRDEDAPLCKGHIINKAFQHSARVWTVQRQDVDNFFGTNFESDFGTLQVAKTWQDRQFISDKKTYSKLAPKLQVGGQEIDYYFPKGKIPQGFATAEVDDGGVPKVIGLRMTQEELLAASQDDWTFEVSKDVRLHALVSVIKAAHLTLFSLLGYRYALSAAGRFVGYDVLGKFFIENVGNDRSQILQRGEVHFGEFVHMLRPVKHPTSVFPGTITDRKLLTCWGSSGFPWAMIVFVRTGEQLHAVMIPVFEHPNSIDAFMSFVHNDLDSVVARITLYDKDEVWRIEKCNRRLHWPKKGLFCLQVEPSDV